MALNLLVASVVDVVKQELFTDKCESIEKCGSIHRIIQYLNEYEKNPIQFSQQSSPFLTDDFNHILMKHLAENDMVTRNKEFESIYDYITDQLPSCHLEKCNVYIRNNRNRETNDVISSINTGTDDTKDENININNSSASYILEMMDTMHCFLLHSFDCGFRIRSSELITNINDAKNDIDTDQDKNLHNDEAMTKLYSYLKAKRQRIQDIWGAERAQHTKFVTNLNVDKQANSTSNINTSSTKQGTKQYSFGNKYEYNYSAWQDGSGHVDGYVKAKYADLHDELLNNKVFTIDKNAFNVIIDKAAHKISTYYAKSNFDALTKEHIIALLLYTDLDELSYHFSSTFRGIGGDSFGDAAKKNAEFANWSQLLIDAVTVHGTSVDKSNIEVLYHGINCKLIFSSFLSTFVGPTSTTVQIAVATIFAKDGGMILELDWAGGNNSAGRYFNCTWLSSYSNEDERLFIRENELRIVGFRDMKTQQNYAVYVHAIISFTCLIDCGKDFDDTYNWAGNKWKKSEYDEAIIKRLLKHYDKRNEYKNTFPQYINDTFETFMNYNVDSIQFQMNDLNTDYKKLRKIFINENVTMFKLVDICGMFDKCRQIRFYYGDLVEKKAFNFDDMCWNSLLSEINIIAYKSKILLFKVEIMSVTINCAKFDVYREKMENLGYELTYKKSNDDGGNYDLLMRIINQLKIPLSKDKEEYKLELLTWGLIHMGHYSGWDPHQYFIWRDIFPIAKVFVGYIFRILGFTFSD